MNKVVKNIQYFQNRRDGFERLFSSLLKKYQTYGAEVDGRVSLKNPTEAEKEYISSFIGKDYRRNQTISLTFRKIEATLREREFEVVNIKMLLEQYYNQPQLTMKEMDHRKRLNYQLFIGSISFLSTHPFFKWYLESVEAKSIGYRRFQALYKENQNILLKYLQQIATGLSHLPKENKIRLPYFSSKVTGNPHAFDTNKEFGKIFLEVLKIAFIREGQKIFQYETKAEQVQELLLSAGILKDDVTNYVGFTGLQILDEFDEESNIYKVGYSIGKVNLEPLREVIKFNSVKSYWNNQYVFVVEGSGIFSTIVDEVLYKLGNVPPLICTFGQFRVSAIKLINLLVKNGYTILYSGDHDPHGVLMAQQLYNRFGERVIPWGYNKKLYENTTSKEVIANSELSLLKSVDHPELQEVKELLYTSKTVCYQEEFTSELVEDILSFSSMSY